MKAFPIAILVLLAFAAFSLTFLVAPLAVLLLFYAIFAFGPWSSKKPAPPATPQSAGRTWDVAPDDAPADDEPPPPAPARRARVTVVSRTTEVAAEPVTADAPADATAPPAAGPTTPTAPRHS